MVFHANYTVNVDDAKDIGQGILASMTVKSVTEFAFKQSNQAVTLATKSLVKIDGNTIRVDLQFLFQRPIVALKSLDGNSLQKLNYAARDLVSLILYFFCSNHTSQFLLMLFGLCLWKAQMSQFLKESSNLFWMVVDSFTESLGRKGLPIGISVYCTAIICTCSVER